jgi:hypothetical protein
MQNVLNICRKLHWVTACRCVLALLLLVAVVLWQALPKDIQVRFGMLNSSSHTSQARVWQLAPALCHKQLVDPADVCHVLQVPRCHLCCCCDHRFDSSIPEGPPRPQVCK